VYVIAVQQLDYVPPVNVSMSCTSHWLLMLQGFLDSQRYDMVASAVTAQTAVCAIVRRSLIPAVHNVGWSTAKLLPFRSRQVKKDAATSNLDNERDRRQGRDLPEIAGGSVIFQIHETALCFVNLFLDSAKAQQHSWQDRYLHLKSGIDLDTDFNHVFLLGKVFEREQDSMARNMVGQWAPLLSTGGVLSSVLYKPLDEAQHLSRIEEVVWPAESAPLLGGIRPPSALTLALTVPQPMQIPVSLELPSSKFFLTLSGLRATVDLLAADPQAKLDSYLVIDSPFTAKAHRTGTARKTTTPSWNEVVGLHVFVADPAYLREQHLRIELWTTRITGDVVLARSALGLRAAFSSSSDLASSVVPFSVELLCSGRVAGWLTGSVSISEVGPAEPLCQPRVFVSQPMSSYIVSQDYSTSGTERQTPSPLPFPTQPSAVVVTAPLPSRPQPPSRPPPPIPEPIPARPAIPQHPPPKPPTKDLIDL
jgi:hypothetical protein